MLCSGRFLRRNGNKEEEKMKNNNRFTTAQLTLLGLMAAILLLMAYTPLGYLNIGPLAISFNVIPVAISAVVLGPVGGAVAGAIFGLTSFLQCIGVGAPVRWELCFLVSIRYLLLSSDLYHDFSMVSAWDTSSEVCVKSAILM